MEEAAVSLLAAGVFIFLYLFLITFIVAYNIQIASNQDAINTGYENYYQCLIYAQPDCGLSDSVSNYNLVMLKGFAISSLGTFLFLIFFSWDILVFWYQLITTMGAVLIKKSEPESLVLLLAYEKSEQRTSLKGSLDVSQTEMEDADHVTHSSQHSDTTDTSSEGSG